MEHWRATERWGRFWLWAWWLWAWLDIRSTVVIETSFGRLNIWNVYLGSRVDSNSFEGSY